MQSRLHELKSKSSVIVKLRFYRPRKSIDGVCPQAIHWATGVQFLVVS